MTVRRHPSGLPRSANLTMSQSGCFIPRMLRARSWLALILAANATCCPEVVPTGSYVDALHERCGNGVVDTDIEECDAGDANADDAACTATCKVGFCGDGLVIDGVEEWDDGEGNGPTASCSESCVAAVCGDGIVQVDEECDLGEGNSDDAFGGGCSLDCEIIPGCGDGLLEPSLEECDDGNQIDTDACTNACTNAVCGDGIVQEGVEGCDDANMIDTDACVACQPAFCGDGIIQEGVEECDGAENCNGACVRDRLVFVTAETHDGDFAGGGMLTGIEAADAFCRSRALAAGLDVNGTDFWAWLSDAETSPAQRFFQSAGRYVMPDGTVIAESWADLTDGELLAPLQVTEHGELVDTPLVWSNTGIDGAPAADPQSCDGWTTSDFMVLGRFGIAQYSDARWTDDVGPANPTGCPDAAHLYCFEQQ